MDGRCIQRLCPILDAQEPCGLFKCLWTESRHLPKRSARLEWTISITMGNHILGQLRPDPCHMREQRRAGSVHIHPYFIHHTFHHAIQCMRKRSLIYVMLVESYADG